MADIRSIPDAELETDRAESIQDISRCAIALGVGIDAHRDGFSVVERIEKNCKIIRSIDAERNRRMAERIAHSTLMPDQELKEVARQLLDAALAYKRAYQKAGGKSAVVWVEDTDGRLVVLTRGDYRETIMANIGGIVENAVPFDAD